MGIVIMDSASAMMDVYAYRISPVTGLFIGVSKSGSQSLGVAHDLGLTRIFLDLSLI